jgi:hypothetical protein
VAEPAPLTPVDPAADDGPVPYTQEQVAQVVGRIKLVPDRDRVFTESLTDVRRTHRIGPDLLTELLDLGLPHRGHGDDRRFDALDLGNVGVALALPCPRRLAMRWWSKALSRTVPGVRSVYSLELSADCPRPGHDGPCRFRPHEDLLAAVRPGSLRELDVNTFAFEVELATADRLFGEPFTPVIEEALRLRFHILPRQGVGVDPGFLAETGLADCRLATMHLNLFGRGLGLPVRAALGYFVSPPYAQEHAWLEFGAGGHWWAADPFLLKSLAGWGIVDPEQWPPHRSTDGVMWRLADRAHIGLTRLAHDDVEQVSNLAIVGRRPG